jgi:hypothetical protein
LGIEKEIVIGNRMIRPSLAASHELRYWPSMGLGVHAALKSIEKEANEELKQIDKRSPRIMMQGICLFLDRLGLSLVSDRSERELRGNDLFNSNSSVYFAFYPRSNEIFTD